VGTCGLRLGSPMRTSHLTLPIKVFGKVIWVSDEEIQLGAEIGATAEFTEGKRSLPWLFEYMNGCVSTELLIQLDRSQKL
jgi:hypothetical protein